MMWMMAKVRQPRTWMTKMTIREMMMMVQASNRTKVITAVNLTQIRRIHQTIHNKWMMIKMMLDMDSMDQGMVRGEVKHLLSATAPLLTTPMNTLSLRSTPGPPIGLTTETSKERNSRLTIKPKKPVIGANMDKTRGLAQASQTATEDLFHPSSKMDT